MTVILSVGHLQTNCKTGICKLETRVINKGRKLISFKAYLAIYYLLTKMDVNKSVSRDIEWTILNVTKEHLIDGKRLNSGNFGIPFNDKMIKW